MVPAPSTLPSLSKLHGLMGSSLESADKENTRLRSGLQFHMICRQHLEVDSYNITAPFWYDLEEYGEGKFFQRTERQALHVAVQVT